MSDDVRLEPIGVPRRPYLFRLLRSLAIAWLLVAVLAFIFQRSLIYRPPEKVAGPWLETITLDRDGVEVHAARRAGTGSDALLYFGGNAEDVSVSLGLIGDLAPQATVYGMHYRGYGPSGGSPSESALVGDARALYDRVRRDHDRVDIVGWSLGAAVALSVAEAREVRRMALITPFDRLATAAGRSVPFLPVRWMLRDRWDSIARAGEIKTPTFVIAAERDLVIPPSAAERLRDALPAESTRFLLVRGAGHGSVLAVGQARDDLRAFLDGRAEAEAPREGAPAQESEDPADDR